MDADIYVRKGSFFEVTVQSNHNIIDDISTHVSGEQLYLETRKCLRDHNTTITITTPNLRSVSNFGSGHIHSADIWGANHMKLTLSGSGEVELPVDCDNLDVTLTGSGSFELSGYAGHLRSVISGSGNINAFALSTNTCSATISGSGNTFIHVADSLTGTITGSGNIYYRGFPDTIDVIVSGSGRVINRN
ncbi:head GIN domain-containing protein [Fulvivirga kasyanovii]